MKRILGIVVLCFVLASCDSGKPYAALVNGQRITNDDVATAAAVQQFLNDSQATKLPPVPTMPTSGATSVLQQMIRAEVLAPAVAKNGFEISQKLRDEFLEIVGSNPQGSAAVGRLRTLPEDQQNLVIDLTIKQLLYTAVSNGIKGTDSAEVVCVKRWVYVDRAKAEQAKTQSEATRDNGADLTSRDCIVAKGSNAAFKDAVASVPSGQTVGPINAVEQQTDTFQIIKVETRQTAKASEWPLTVFNTLPTTRATAKFDDLFAKADISISPEYGELAPPNAQCPNPCITPPPTPKLLPTTTSVPQALPFG